MQYINIITIKYIGSHTHDVVEDFVYFSGMKPFFPSSIVKRVWVDCVYKCCICIYIKYGKILRRLFVLEIIQKHQHWKLFALLCVLVVWISWKRIRKTFVIHLTCQIATHTHTHVCVMYYKHITAHSRIKFFRRIFSIFTLICSTRVRMKRANLSLLYILICRTVIVKKRFKNHVPIYKFKKILLWRICVVWKCEWKCKHTFSFQFAGDGYFPLKLLILSYCETNKKL